MLFGDNLQDTRQLFFSSFKKYQDKQPLTALEQQLIRVILDHPEYHDLLSHVDGENSYVYEPQSGQENPFLHMGLHLALRDQIQLDNPQGIKAIFETLYLKHGDVLFVEHLMIERLALCLWEAQRHQQQPNTERYLNSCRELV